MTIRYSLLPGVVLLAILAFAALNVFGCAQYGDDTPPADPPAQTDGGAAVQTDSGSTQVVTGQYAVARACGADCIEFNGMYCDAATATLVGDCAVEGISWDQGKSVTKGANGWYQYTLIGAAQECHVSLKDCNNVPTTCTGGGTWADYGCAGSPAAPGTQQGGPFMYCGKYLGGDYTCNIAFIKAAGAAPEPRGIVPNGP